eukprot:gene3164-31551_t
MFDSMFSQQPSWSRARQQRRQHHNPNLYQHQFQRRSPYRTAATTTTTTEPQQRHQHESQRQQQQQQQQQQLIQQRRTPLQQQPRYRVRAHYIGSDGYRSRDTDTGATTRRRDRRGYYEVLFDDGVTQFLPAEWIQVLAKISPATQLSTHPPKNPQQSQQQYASPSSRPSSDEERDDLMSARSEDDASNVEEEEEEEEEEEKNTTPPASSSSCFSGSLQSRSRPRSSEGSQSSATSWRRKAYQKQQPKTSVALVEGISIEEAQSFPENRVPLHRRLPDNYPYVLEKIGEGVPPLPFAAC